MPESARRGIKDFLRPFWPGGLLLIIITLLAYGPAFTAGFVYDDDVYVTGNTLLTEPDGFRLIWSPAETPLPYFPLTYTSFYLERRMWGLNPGGYHLVNVLLQAADALLLWRILLQLQVPGAWLAAAIFAIHPVQVDSVTFISERKNVLMGLFFLLTLWAWLRFVDKDRARPQRYYVLSLICFALALTAKPTACTLPAALLLILWLKKMPINWRRLAQVSVFVAMGLIMGLLSMWWEHRAHDAAGNPFHIGLIERGLIASRAIWFYAGKLFWPAALSIEYPRWNISASNPSAYYWVAATAALGAIIWWARRWTGRGVEAGVLFFVATLSPMLGFIMHRMYMYSFVADHFQYLACVGLIAPTAAGLEISLKRIAGRNVFLVVSGILLIALGAITWNQSGMYVDAETFWQRTLEGNPNSLLANTSLAAAEMKNSQLDEAVAHYQKALETRPDYESLHYNLGLCFFMQRRLDEAVTQYKKEIEINPGYALAHNNLGKALDQKGEADEAISEYEKALAIEPDLAMAHDNLGTTLLKKGKLDEAIAHLQRAAQIQPGFAGEQNSLGIAYAKKGRPREAVSHFQKALETDPNDIEACNNLAWLLATTSDSSLRDGLKALALAQQASQLAGKENPAILQSLAAANAEAGNYKEAITTARRALELVVKNNLLAGRLQKEIKLFEAGVPERDSASRWAW